ncbi:hypothetical protein EMGBS3_07740 [Anaerolineaceae bacterium]|nr:hypothetical protein EMGBS3_07740 [Anaerolineaceae bacterium]
MAVRPDAVHVAHTVLDHHNLIRIERVVQRAVHTHPQAKPQRARHYNEKRQPAQRATRVALQPHAVPGCHERATNLLRHFFAILTVLAGSLWLVPLARRRLAAADLADAAVMAVGIGASLGGLSLWMLVLGLLPGAWLLPALVLPVPWLGLALQLLGGQHTTPRHKAGPGSTAGAAVRRHAARNHNQHALLSLLPLRRAGALCAKTRGSCLKRAHISASLTGYPLAVQLQYAFAFMAAGAVNDHYAGVIVAAYAAALALAAFAVARMAFNGRAAWCAVVLLLSAPLFVDWATSGYVDVPVALYHALALLFALRWLHSGARADALGAGICAGLGILTKHSALVLLPAVAVVPLLRNRSRTDFENAALALLAAFAPAGPWYARNLLLAGWGGVLPAPGAYDAQALDTSIATLLTFWSDRAEWGAPFSIAAAGGLLLAAAQLLYPRLNPAVPNARQRIWLFAAFIVPYQLLWWQGFSYQTRYLLASAPMFAAIGGYGVDWLLQRVPALARLPQPRCLGWLPGCWRWAPTAGWVRCITLRCTRCKATRTNLRA